MCVYVGEGFVMLSCYVGFVTTVVFYNVVKIKIKK